MRKLCIFVLLVVLSPLGSAAEAYRYSGPYNKENLSVILIHGESKYKNDLLTLTEAMKQGKVKVYETGNVNKLAIENVSKEDVYIQAGDIVKGGKQDRVFSDDMVLPKMSGKQDISSFCVESGRWRKRGKENVQHFSQSSYRLASKDLKLAAKMKKNQADVWDKVNQLQRKMGRALGKNVQKQESASSLQLSLEDQDAQMKVQDYEKSLKTLVNKKDVLGFAFAINGDLNSVDVYANNKLFKKMWPRLLRAAATEALMERDVKNKRYAPLDEKQVEKMMKQNLGKQKQAEINARTQIRTTDSKESFKALTMDKQNNVVVHTNLIVK